MEEQRIYAVVAGTVLVPARRVIQPPGRQIAQACHAVSKLRIVNRMWHDSDSDGRPLFNPLTTIILQARDEKELGHVFDLLKKKKLNPVMFDDTNDEVYGRGVGVTTAIAVLAVKKQVEGILDYLPLWGSQ